MILQAILFYIFAAVAVAVGGDGGLGAQPGAFGAVSDPRLLQRGRAVRADRRRVPGDDPGHRLCRRGRGAVPLRRDDARHRLRRSCAAALCAICRSARWSGSILLAELVLVFGSWALIAAGPSPALARRSPAAAALTNTRALGDLLYTRYLFAFQAAGLILLVAMIGAIVLTLRHRAGVRRQIDRGAARAARARADRSRSSRCRSARRGCD